MFTILFLTLITVIFPHCSQPKNATSRGGRTDIQNLLILPIYADIEVIENKDKGIRNEVQSAATEIKITKYLENHIPASVDKIFLSCNDLQKKVILDTTIQFMTRFRKAKFHNGIKSPKVLTETLDSLHKDYGLLVFHGGFTRTPENFKTEYIRRHNISLYSLGFYDTYPYNSYSLMICMLLEKETGRVVKYKELKWPNKDPNAAIVIWAQIQDLISSFFL